MLTLHVAVYHAHDVVRTQAVHLAEVDEQPLVALFCLAVVSAPASALASFAFTVLAVAAAVTVVKLNVLAVVVVVEETVELHRHHALYHVLLVQPVELAEHLGHKLGYLLLVHLHLLKVVDDLHQLLLAYLLARRHLALLEFLPDDLLYLPHLALLAQVDDGNRCALLAGTARTSAAVGVVFDVVGQTVVDDVCQVVDIQSAGSHVGGHEQLQMAQTELLHHEVTRRLRQLAVQCVGVIALLHQLVGNLLRLKSCAAEDDAVDIRIEIDDALQRLILVPGMYAEDHVVDIRRALVLASYGYLLRVVQIVLGNLLYLLAHRRTEHQRRTLLWHGIENGVQVFGEPHVEHLVGLIENDVLHVVQLHHIAAHQVEQTPWGGNDDVHALLQAAYLALDGRASVDRKHTDTVEIA